MVLNLWYLRMLSVDINIVEAGRRHARIYMLFARLVRRVPVLPAIADRQVSLFGAELFAALN